MMIEFEDFSKNIGLNNYPFSVFTAEEEKEFLNKAFIRPIAYSTSSSAAKEGKNVFIYGERGTGKTALLYRLTTECAASIVPISDYSALPLIPNKSDIHGFYLDNLSGLILRTIAASISLRTKINKQDKLLLSYLLKKHTTSISRNSILNEMQVIQHSWMKRAGVSIWNSLLGLLNNVAGAAVDAASDAISKSMGLPSIGAAGDKKEYFKQIHLSVDDTFDESTANSIILGKALDLCGKIGISRTTFILDRIDEDSRWKNDSDLIADFLRPFLTENELFYNQKLQFIFSIWSIPYQKVKSDFRSNKFCVEPIEWTADALMLVLNKRLAEHSNSGINNYAEIFEDPDYFKKDVVPLANANPRDLWQLMHKIFREQYRINAQATKISVEAMDFGIKEFVKGFSYYEYYPKKNNAKSNTMDVYSYIAHLLKLSKCQFTTTTLDEAARTGGSTSNYIVGMEAMGLVRRCEEKGPKGSNLYEIRDPKVKYAVLNNIDIRRDA
ncbi:hypothetical protein GTP55_25840 [Duganella sp. FT109W]|uniref:ATP-binding protein n=1 Tax=Duganella margarita TaxID=2692170 RepID=A0ABW9WRL2_9BURK|nr:hypothetical protein [Duganella margarita]MYN42770.1 hypothetical protein [Duganella margarita]